jgi:hypothetical protein
MAASIVQIPVWSLARARRVSVPTSLTSILTVPVVGDNLLVYVGGFLRVLNVSTTVTVQVSWTDPDGGADSIAWYTSQTLSPGGYSLAVLPIAAAQGSTVQIQAQSSVSGAALLWADLLASE